MYIHWETLIKPLFDALKPKNIVEVGSENGDNTRNLLEYCRQNDAVLHAIEPVPNFDVAAWQEQYGDKFVFYRSLSLNALPLIEKMDLVLIDGDHNWYTVYNELKLIEKLSHHQEQGFPLIILHDVDWPYARRDLYYDPDTIPAAYLKPYKKMGIKPGSPELVEEGGMNARLNNAIYEHTLQNGVLTAVEDFLDETKLNLELVNIPAYHGLGFLYPTKYKQNSDFASYIEGISASKHLIELMDHLEKSRIEHKITIKDLQNTVVHTENRASADSARFKRQLEELENARHLAIENYKQKLQELEYVRQQTVESYRNKVEQKDKEIARYKKKVETQGKAIARLKDWINQLNKGYNSLIASRRWRIGNYFVNIYNKLTFKKIKPADVEFMNKVFNRFKAWEKKQKKGSNSCSIDNAISPEEIKQLLQTTEGLVNNLQQLLRSKRWRLGNFLVSMAAIPLFRGITAPEAVKIKTVISRVKSLQVKSIQTEQDFKKLCDLVEQLEYQYTRLMQTRRWKAGNKIIAAANRLILKKQQDPVPEKIRKLFKQFKKQEKELAKRRRKKNKKQVNFLAPVSVAEAQGEPYTLRAP